MLFLNSGARNVTIAGIITHDRPYTHKMGHSFIVCSCLSIIIGLILIIVGVSSAASKTTFVGIGIISLGVGLFLTTFVCLYGKLDRCYNNWAYRSRVLPVNLETPRPIPLSTVSHSPFIESPAAISKLQSLGLRHSPEPLTTISDVEIPKFVIAPSIEPRISAM